MKRVLALLIAAMMLCSMIVLPASAITSYELADIRNSDQSYLELNKSNTSGYLMYVTGWNEDGTPAAMGESPASGVITGDIVCGNKTFNSDDCAFIMVAGIHNGKQVPAYVEWAVEGYQYAQAYVGPGNWDHSTAQDYTFKLVAVNAEGGQTVLATAVAQRDVAPAKLVGKLPEGTTHVRITLTNATGNFSATSCVIAEAVAYNVEEGKAPHTGAYTATVQSMNQIIASGTPYMELTHKNYTDFTLEPNPAVTPLPSDHTHIQIGGKDYDVDHCFFINIAGNGSDFASQTPGFVYWELDENAAEYNVFQCDFGKSTAYSHGGGAPVQLVVYACQGYDDMTGRGLKEVEIARSAFVSQGDAAVRVAGLIPAGTDGIRVELWSQNGNYSSCTTDVVDCIVYKADAAYVPATSVNIPTLEYTKNTDGAATAYLYYNLPEAIAVAADWTFCYDVMLSAPVPGMGALNPVRTEGGDFRDAGAGIGFLDQDGIGAHPKTDLSAVATNKWYSRSFAMTGYPGTIDKIIIGADKGLDGADPAAYVAATAIYKNICFKDATGAIVWQLDPTALTIDSTFETGDITKLVVDEGTEVAVSVGSSAGVANATPRAEFPADETQPPVDTGNGETNPPESNGNGETNPPESNGGDATGEGTGTPDTKPTDDEGCGSMISAGALVLAAIVAAPIALKKRK